MTVLGDEVAARAYTCWYGAVSSVGRLCGVGRRYLYMGCAVHQDAARSKLDFQVMGGALSIRARRII